MLKMAVCEYETNYKSNHMLVNQGWEGGTHIGSEQQTSALFQI